MIPSDGEDGEQVVKIPWRHRLFTRALFFLVIACVLPLLLVCGAVLYYIGQDAKKRAEDSLVMSASDASRQVEYYLAKMEGSMRFIASRLDHDHLDSPGNRSLVAAYATTTVNDVETIWVRSSSGAMAVIYSRDEMLRKEAPPAWSGSVREPADSGFVWSPTTYNEFGEAILTASTPIRHPWEKRVFGQLIFTVRPGHFLRDTVNINTGRNGSAYLVDQEGRLISHRGAGPAGKLGDMSSHPAGRLLRGAAAGNAPIVTQTADHIIACRKLTPSRWGVIVEQSKAEVYRTRNHLALLVIGSFGLLITLMIPLVFILSLQLTRPILELLRAMQHFADSDKVTLSKVTGPGELGLVAEAFHRMAEQRIKTEKRYREIVDDTDNLITQVDREGRVVFVNHVGEQIFGASLDKLVGEPVFALVHPDDRERTEAWFSDCVAKGIEQASMENRQISSDGTVFHFLWTCHFNYDQNGELSGVSGIAHNITERRTMEEERRKNEARLLQSQKMESIGTLAGGIAHDFNNILTPILGYTEIILASFPLPDGMTEKMLAIQKAALRAKELVQQILVFSRRTTQERKALHPHVVVKETVKLLRATLPSTIEIREEIASDCGMILGDPTQVQQIVLNLGANAFHAMRGKGGVLAITLKNIEIPENSDYVIGLDAVAGPYLALEVSDTGCGISHEHLQKIFDPYFTTKAAGEGTGLGLAIVHGIVKSYGGHITVYSEPGHGTTFHVYLPRLIGEERPIETSEQEQEPPAGGNERLLVVDDEPVITAMLADFLTGLGYDVTPCNDSVTALNLFTDSPDCFDLILTDMTMPKVNGVELVKKAFEIRPGMPAILCTGFSEVINREQAIALGIKAFVEKPTRGKDLAKTIRTVLDSR